MSQTRRQFVTVTALGSLGAAVPTTLVAAPTKRLPVLEVEILRSTVHAMTHQPSDGNGYVGIFAARVLAEEAASLRVDGPSGDQSQEIAKRFRAHGFNATTQSVHDYYAAFPTEYIEQLRAQITQHGVKKLVHHHANRVQQVLEADSNELRPAQGQHAPVGGWRCTVLKDVQYFNQGMGMLAGASLGVPVGTAFALTFWGLGTIFGRIYDADCSGQGGIRYPFLGGPHAPRQL